MKKGQTILSVLMWAIPITISGFGGLYYFTNAINEKNITEHGNIKTEFTNEISTLKSKIEVLKVNQEYAAKDITEIKENIKIILKAFDLK